MYQSCPTVIKGCECLGKGFGCIYIIIWCLGLKGLVLPKTEAPTVGFSVPRFRHYGGSWVDVSYSLNS